MKIVRVFTRIFIGFIILFLTLISILVFLVKFNNTSLFGEMIKSVVIKYPMAVNLINLNEPGDARYVFIKAAKAIDVGVCYSDGFVPDKNINIWIGKMVLETLGVKANIKVQPCDIEAKDAYTTADLNNIYKKLVPRFSLKPVLYIFYLNSYADMPSNVGITLHRNAFFIFDGSLKILTSENTILSQLEESTLMHEWGHILGLNHQENDNCIMSEKVEVYDNSSGQNIATDYCGETLGELRAIKNRIK